jgi:hypothetical protein
MTNKHYIYDYCLLIEVSLLLFLPLTLIGDNYRHINLVTFFNFHSEWMLSLIPPYTPLEVHFLDYVFHL